MTRNVLLLGSVPLADADAVFERAGSVLGSLLRRVPDGETGERKGWIRFQEAVVANNSQFELADTTSTTHAAGITFRNYRLKDGVRPEDISFGSMGYVQNAEQSYAKFVDYRRAGKLPTGIRFQVTMPTPIAFLWSFITDHQLPIVEPAYMKRVMQEVAEIAAIVPPEDLAFQWDTVHELIILEGARKVNLPSTEEAFVGRLARLGACVPQGAELGYHLCYGDSGRKHSVDPKDMGLMVRFVNRLVDTTSRQINYVHMPVPRDRDDEAYFAPLVDLKLQQGTELYLGLVHLTDGAAGTARRVAAASQFVSHFGVATECGMGRRAPETTEELLGLHRQAAL